MTKARFTPASIRKSLEFAINKDRAVDQKSL